MIDIHHHLIFAVDDGSPDLDTSLAMARQAASSGITHIVCTPHASDQFPYREEIIRERFALLRETLAGEIELSLACDFHLTAENVFDAVSHPYKYSIDGNGYLLIEFDSMSIPPQIENAVDMLQAAGYTPIVTHPERYPALLKRPEMLARWVRNGCLVQVTAGSLTGRFGRQAESFSNELLEGNWIHFIATDAHNLTSRPPNLSEAFHYISKVRSEDVARRLCFKNPKAAVDGKPLPSQPEPRALWSTNPFAEWSSRNESSNNHSMAHSTRKRSWLSRILQA